MGPEQALAADELLTITDVAVRARLAMTAMMASGSTTACAKELLRAMKFPANQARFGALFMELGRPLEQKRPTEINQQLKDWIEGSKAGSARSSARLYEPEAGFLPYPEDRTKLAKDMAAFGVYCNSQGRRRKKWGRPASSASPFGNSVADHGGRPSFYAKTDRLFRLESIFASVEARELVYFMLNHDLFLFHFVRFTLTVMLEMLAVNPDIAERIVTLTNGSSSKVTISQTVSRADALLVATVWAGRLTPTLKDTPFFLFSLETTR